MQRGGVEVLVHGNADNGDNCDRVNVPEVRPRLSSYRVTQGTIEQLLRPHSLIIQYHCSYDNWCRDGRRAENVRKPRSSGQRPNLNQPRPHFWIIFDELAGARAGARQGYCRDHQRQDWDLHES